MDEVWKRIEFYDQIIAENGGICTRNANHNAALEELAQLQDAVKKRFVASFSEYQAYRQAFERVFEPFDSVDSAELRNYLKSGEKTIAYLRELCTSLLRMRAGYSGAADEGLVYESAECVCVSPIATEYQAQCCYKPLLNPSQSDDSFYPAPATVCNAGTGDATVQTEVVASHAFYRTEIMTLMRRLSESQNAAATLAEENEDLRARLTAAESNALQSRSSKSDTSNVQNSVQTSPNVTKTEDRVIEAPPTPLRTILHANKQQIALLRSQNEELDAKNKMLRDRNNQLLLNNRELQKALEYYKKHCKYAELNEQMQGQNRELVETVQRLKRQLCDLQESRAE